MHSETLLTSVQSLETLGKLTEVSGYARISAVQTPVLSPPAPAPAKKTPAPVENFRLVQICQNWKFLQFKLETPSL